MRKFHKGIDLYEAQIKRLQETQTSIEGSVDIMKDQALADAIALTGGSISSKRLRKLGHPFARSKGKALLSGRVSTKSKVPLLPINVQSGRLRRAFKSRLYPKQGFDIVVKNVPYAKYILSSRGTEKMIARGLKEEVVRRLKARQKAHLDAIAKGIIR